VIVSMLCTAGEYYPYTAWKNWCVNVCKAGVCRGGWGVFVCIRVNMQHN
jgi:hypothetical protein